MSEGGVRRERLLATFAVLLIAVVVLGASISETLAARNTSHYAVTQFDVTVQPVLNLEGSVDGVSWEESPALSFTPEQMALQVGEENAIYSPMLVRGGPGTNSAAAAEVNVALEEVGASDFGDSLRGQIFEGATSCDAAGTGEEYLLTAGEGLRAQASDSFEVPIPETIGEAGVPTELCVKVWMNDNNWLLGGAAPPVVTATWTVSGETVQ